MSQQMPDFHIVFPLPSKFRDEIGNTVSQRQLAPLNQLNGRHPHDRFCDGGDQKDSVIAQWFRVFRILSASMDLSRECLSGPCHD